MQVETIDKDTCTDDITKKAFASADWAFLCKLTNSTFLYLHMDFIIFNIIRKTKKKIKLPNPTHVNLKEIDKI